MEELPHAPHLVLAGTFRLSLLAPGLTTGFLINHSYQVSLLKAHTPV